LFYSDRSVRGGRFSNIRYRTDGVFVFGIVEVLQPGGATAWMQAAASAAYGRIFEFLGCLDPGNRLRLWRIWNYLSDINGIDGELERYRQFNMGRADAFGAHWTSAGQDPGAPASFNSEIPAACGIGTIDAPRCDQSRLTIAFLASAMNFAQIENPRQLSAFRYPAEYGPASPTFSRAVLGPADVGFGQRGAHLFISGTASIVGHRTLHCADVAEQCRESLRNIDAIVQEANKKLAAWKQSTMTMADLDYLVYIRHPRDIAAVHGVLSEWLGHLAGVHYVHAEICRSDLLVEIEATRLSVAPRE
jgi:enamine deaminase RidA (YjgF/YER057c/UK114 family)